MTKHRKSTRPVEDIAVRKPKPEPKLTRAGFHAAVWVIILGFIAQMVMAFMVYPSLPSRIPSSWIGHLVPQATVPSWTVFLVFPLGQIGLLLVGIFTPRDNDGRRIMETGKAWTLTILAILFTILQSSAFHLAHS